MSKLSEIRDKALTKGVDALVPVVSKVSETVHDLAQGPVGKVVGSAASVGSHVVSKAPVIGRFVGGHDSPGSNGHSWGSAVSEASSDQAVGSPSAATSAGSGSSVSAARSDAPARAPRKTPKGSKAPAKKTTVRKVGKTEAAPETTGIDSSPELGSRSPGGATPTDARELPITGYTKLSVAKIQARLDGLTQTDLAALYRFEKANQGRSTLLKALDKKMVRLPLPLYDSLTLPAILDDLNGLTKPELKVIRDYEARTGNRLPILERIDELLAVPLPGE